jgi:hypothetical protein
MDSTIIDLDISWIKEHERLQNIETNHFREPMNNIDLIFIYINPNLYIDKIIREQYPLSWDSSNNCSRLSKECLLKIIQNNKKLSRSNNGSSSDFRKYKFIDILTYNIDLEPEHVQNYSKNENIEESSHGFLKNLSIIDDIAIPPSIFIFHKINCIFLLYQEIETNHHRHTLKSILKKPIAILGSTQDDPNQKQGSQKITKKVRIDLNQNNIQYREHSHIKNKPNNKTKKNICIMNSIDSNSITFVST